MRVYIKKQILELKETIHNAFFYVEEENNNSHYEQAYQMIVELQQTLIKVGEMIEAEAIRDIYVNVAIEKLEHACEMLFLSTEALGTLQFITYIDCAKKDYEESMNILIANIENDLIKIVFMPYKASMWTSMESIWEAAEQDTSCDVKVVPIPYSILDKNVKEEVYEINEFPKYISVLNHNEYDVEKDRPDIIIIHNPYDGSNTLTKVPEKYYSKNLKKYTNCLVYSPYHTFGGYVKGITDSFVTPVAAIYADKIIVQSDFVKEIYLSRGVRENKLVTYGSPKADSIVKLSDNKWPMPEEWKAKLGNKKKIILLNTHWAYFMKGKQKEKEGGNDFAVRYHEEFFSAIEKNKDEIGFIWRPHPLMFEAAKQRDEQCVNYINNYLKRIEECDYAVVDRNSDYRYAFSNSDALVTTYSSLLNEYLITGKPVMIFQKKPEDDIGEASPIDHRSCYFRFSGDDNLTFEEFVTMLLSNKDKGYTKRMELLKNKSFANLDGTAGKKIHKYLLEEIRGFV